MPATVEEIVINLARPTDDIHRDLRARFPKVVDLNWELAEDERSGEVWSGGRTIARLVHGEAS